MPQFSHLHVHTQFSLLDGAADIKKLYAKARENKMPAIAITDHGNMFGAFQFVAEAYKNKIDPNIKGDDPNNLAVKPIVGCEFYVVADRHKKQFTKELKDDRFHQLFLAKNAEGYQNITKMCSLGYMEGLYSKWPRIDKELILQYHKGIIATTCCIGASVPQAILRHGEAEAEKEFKWWLDIFGEDYYIELQRHNLPDQIKVNEVLLRFAEKFNVKIICSNDSHYVDQNDANAHDILLCVNTGDKQSTPKATDEEGGRGYRFGFPNDQFYFKTQEEMAQLFSDLPQALDNTNEIVSKVETLNLKREILVPNFPLPVEYANADDYLRHLTFKGAHERYGSLTAEIEERLNFELMVIKTMGFPGYFLIVQDFIKAGRDLGVMIGPGRGSAAGSAVAYCIGITNIDPIKYGLLFERFLNPERKSMPDIDTDFDDEGRQKVLDYVVEKYGKNQVAQIINYGTMAAKSAIKDCARVMDLPLNESNELAKLVPERPGVKLKEAIEESSELQEILKGDDLKAQVLREAQKLEGSVRNTGIHASAVIIAPDDLLKYIPVSVAKDSDLLVTQFDGKVIEDAGLLKMDFLGLKTLTIIKNAIALIHKNHGVLLDPEKFPLEDEKTFDLFKKAETVSIFQFESVGMQKHLLNLKADKFEDLIAMNALFRPGPMEYIDDYIDRKHGRKKIEYDLPEMQEHLEATYGITVYQEQVMLLSQKLAGFSKGDADVLRKAMGKKQKDVLDKMKSKFIDGAKERGHDEKICEKIWTDWEAFAQYAFNKSHSTCYAWIAYQTMYLKAHYPSEFMAAVLNSQGNIESLSFFIDECKRMGLEVLGPDVNESEIKFTVNKAGKIRFGLGSIKGFGEAAAISIIEEREAAGSFANAIDLVKRVNLKSVNKRAFEGLIYSGAMDCFSEYHRAQYLNVPDGDRLNGIEKLIKYGNEANLTNGQNVMSLFGDSKEVGLQEPSLPKCEEWSLIEKLKNEKEVIGMYLSGHPLDNYKLELSSFNVLTTEDIQKHAGNSICIAGIVTDAKTRVGKTGREYGTMTLEDLVGTTEISLFSESFLKFKHFLVPDLALYITGRVQPSFRNKEVMELRVDKIQLLSELKQVMAKGLTINLKYEYLTEQLLSNLENLFDSNPGKMPVKFNLFVEEEKLVLAMLSKNKRVDLSTELFMELEKFKGLSFKLN